MKGWVLWENGKVLYTLSNCILIFKTKSDLFDYYGGALGELNNIKRVEVNIK